MPILIEALDRKKHQSYYYAQILPAALNTLGRIGADARAAEQSLVALAKDPNPAIARLAAESLTRIRRGAVTFSKSIRVSTPLEQIGGAGGSCNLTIPD